MNDNAARGYGSCKLGARCLAEEIFHVGMDQPRDVGSPMTRFNLQPSTEASTAARHVEIGSDGIKVRTESVFKRLAGQREGAGVHPWDEFELSATRRSRVHVRRTGRLPRR